MNSVNLIGNITRDVELKYAQSCTAIAKTGIALNKKVKNTQGEYEDKAIFVDITAFGNTGETLNKYFFKGSKIGIDGELNFEQWTAQDGQKRSKLSVIVNKLHFIDKKDSATTQANTDFTQPKQQPYGYAQQQQQPAHTNQQHAQQQQQYSKPQPTQPQPQYNAQSNQVQPRQHQGYPQQQQKQQYPQQPVYTPHNQQPVQQQQPAQQQRVDDSQIPF